MSPRSTRFQGKLFGFTRYIATPREGYITKEDLEQAKLGEQAEQLFKPNEDIKLEGSYTDQGTADDRVKKRRGGRQGRNERLYNELVNELRAKNPNLAEEADRTTRSPVKRKPRADESLGLS